ncbi:hypothetical protein [Mucilaginibacter segetis]|uniref:Outer membrane beta-barrel porin/alpha-amylase n=1 Tax=Mucilaginibacter segetis TaxID=2793071 RepID=A0A934UMC3_9SPHI|nr:hypothetical protein [Mucilaginibacter segetis]MBK0378741.1 hypothetical protein [Mucilaginibacter segetis]
MKKSFFIFLSMIACLTVRAQMPSVKPTVNGSPGNIQPFLFSVNTLTSTSPSWNLYYSGSYGERTAAPFGIDGVDQQVAFKGYLGNRFTLYANASIGIARSGGVASAQQAELLRDFVGGKTTFGPRLGLGLGVSHDLSNVGAVFSRITASFDRASWRIGGNLRFEKAFSSNRDDIDLITSIGFHHRIAGNFFAGVEAVGEDLEGFWEADEAEGGAKLLVGPSVNITPSNSRFSFSLCGGPVFYATHSTAYPSEAIRDIGTIGTQNGFTLRGAVSFNLHQ